MGLFSVFKRKKAPTPAVVHQTWMGIGQYEYAPMMTLSLTIRSWNGGMTKKAVTCNDSVNFRLETCGKMW